MPITAQAQKKLRRDKKSRIKNAAVKTNLRKIIKQMRQKPSAKSLTDAYRVLDKTAKKNIIHPNKANRLKSRLAKLLKK